MREGTLPGAPLAGAVPGHTVAGDSRHYRLLDIRARHWEALATRIGGPALWDRMQALADAAPRAFDQIKLPHGFPRLVVSTIRRGVGEQSRKFFAALRLRGKGE